MKKYILTTLFVLLLMPLGSVFAASAINFNQSAASVTNGQTFQATVLVNPEGTKNYTVKLVLEYPADVVQVTGFAFSSGWTQLSQPGYDSIDNNGGKLIKTAGYPGGFSNNASFGVVTFKALKTGSATVKVGAGSMVLDGSNNNSMNSYGNILVTVDAQDTPANTSSSTNPRPVSTATTTPSEQSESTSSENEIVSTTDAISNASLLAALPTSTKNILYVVIALLVVGAIAGAIFVMNKLKVNKFIKKK